MLLLTDLITVTYIRDTQGVDPCATRTTSEKTTTRALDPHETAHTIYHNKHAIRTRYACTHSFTHRRSQLYRMPSRRCLFLDQILSICTHTVCVHLQYIVPNRLHPESKNCLAFHPLCMRQYEQQPMRHAIRKLSRQRWYKRRRHTRRHQKTVIKGLSNKALIDRRSADKMLLNVSP